MIEQLESVHKHSQSTALKLGVWGVFITLVVTIATGFMFMDVDDPLARKAHWIVLIIGLVITVITVVSILLNDDAQHHYRRNLVAEGRKKAEDADADLKSARADLIKARIDYVRAQTNVLNAPPAARVYQLPTAPASSNAPVFENDERMRDDEDDDPMHDEDATPAEVELEAPRNLPPAKTIAPATPEPEHDMRVTSRGMPIGMTETMAQKEVRIRRLGTLIWERCQACDPVTQKAIKERIEMKEGGLLRSNQDITDALDYLAGQGLIEPSKGQGISRRWMSVIRAERARERARAREGAGR
jgi:hypothetical protein